MLTKIPKFATEREEADWWYQNRDATGESILSSAKSGNGLGPSSHLRRRARQLGVSAESLMKEHSPETAEAKQDIDLPKSA